MLESERDCDVENSSFDNMKASVDHLLLEGTQTRIITVFSVTFLTFLVLGPYLLQGLKGIMGTLEVYPHSW